MIMFNECPESVSCDRPHNASEQTCDSCPIMFFKQYILQVPGATHGLLGLVEHALAHQEEAALTGPIAVHCRLISCLLVLVAAVVVVTVVGYWPKRSSTGRGSVQESTAF